MPNQRTSQPQSFPPQPGIDIWELGNILLRGWRIVVLTVVLLGGLATIYGILQTPQYRAEGLILPPSPKDLEILTLARTGIGRTDPTEIYDTVRRNFGSRDFQRNFIDSIFPDIVGSDQRLYYSASSPDGFDKNTRNAMSMAIDWNYQSHSYWSSWRPLFPSDLRIDVTEDKNSNRPYLIVGINWRNPQEAANLVNHFIMFVDRQTTRAIVAETQEALALRKQNLNAYIEHKRKIADENTRDNITQLEEAATIARSLEIELPITSMGNNNLLYITPPPQFFQDPSKTAKRVYEPPARQRILPLYQPDPSAYRRETQILATSIPPLYTRGWRALEAEAKHLRNRSNNDPYVTGLRELQQELSWISQLEISEESTHVLRIDQPATPPLHQIIDRLWLTSAGIILGLIIGIFFTLVVHVARVYRKSPTLT